MDVISDTIYGSGKGGGRGSDISGRDRARGIRDGISDTCSYRGAMWDTSRVSAIQRRQPRSIQGLLRRSHPAPARNRRWAICRFSS